MGSKEPDIQNISVYDSKYNQPQDCCELCAILPIEVFSTIMTILMSFLEEWDLYTVDPSPLVERTGVFDSQISIFASNTRSQGLTSHVSSPLAESGGLQN